MTASTRCWRLRNQLDEDAWLSHQEQHERQRSGISTLKLQHHRPRLLPARPRPPPCRTTGYGARPWPTRNASSHPISRRADQPGPGLPTNTSCSASCANSRGGRPIRHTRAVAALDALTTWPMWPPAATAHQSSPMAGAALASAIR